MDRGIDNNPCLNEALRQLLFFHSLSEQTLQAIEVEHILNLYPDNSDLQEKSKEKINRLNLFCQEESKDSLFAQNRNHFERNSPGLSVKYLSKESLYYLAFSMALSTFYGLSITGSSEYKMYGNALLENLGYVLN